MEAELQSHVAFHLTGKRAAADLEPVDALGLVPALLARHRDLASLRHDFPAILVGQGDGPCVEALSAVIDRVLHDVAQGDDGERISRHALRMEGVLRRLTAGNAQGSLATLWEQAVAAVGTTGDDLLADSLARVRTALRVEGELAACDTSFAPRLFALAAQRVYAGKARRFTAELRRVLQKLTDILRADFVRSAPGRTAASLRAAVGGSHADAFDFDAMSEMLTAMLPDTAMPESRRRRLNGLIGILRGQRFYPGVDPDVTPYGFAFTTCQEALAAYRERLPDLIELARALEVAELEIAGEYREARHDAFFASFGEDDIDPADRALFPDYFISTSAAALYAAENATLMEMLSAGLPVKALVQTEDILAEAHAGEGHIGFGAKTRQLAHMAMGLNDVFVLQSAVSNLVQYRDRIAHGMAFAGPAVFNVYCPTAVSTAGLAPYLVAAAAMESRAFPAFTFDPSAGPDLASRFDLAGNPQPDADWPVHHFEYEDAVHQRAAEDLAFTAVEFMACDLRLARHFARVPRKRWSEAMISAGAALGRTAQRPAGAIPCVWMVDGQNQLQKVLVDEKLMREARRCRDMWHNLQELGGVHNSHAERLLARERAALAKAAEDAKGTPAAAPPAAASTPVAAPAAPAAADAAEPASDEPYIETPRCTSCNECTNLSSAVFAYNENKQAYVAHPEAATYAILVEAAENCQVAIIHPGKPRNPSEPGLDALLERAKPFL